jgi:hypothetical protein
VTGYSAKQSNFSIKSAVWRTSLPDDQTTGSREALTLQGTPSSSMTYEIRFIYRMKMLRNNPQATPEIGCPFGT